MIPELLVRKKLMRIGGSTCLVIPPSILRILNIQEEVDISTDGKRLIIMAAEPKSKAKK